MKKRQRPVAENLASNSAAAAANNNFERKSAFSQSPHRLKFKLGLREAVEWAVQINFLFYFRFQTDFLHSDFKNNARNRYIHDNVNSFVRLQYKKSFWH